jgi:glucosamine-6-phosphate deaminase
MKVVVAEDYEDLSHRAAAWLRVVMANTNNPTIVVLPTGNTPLGLYRDLAVEPNRHFLKNAQFIQLDEYQGIARNDSRTLAGWFRRVFLEPLSIPLRALCSFDPCSPDPDVEAARMDGIATQTGIDICVLGLGQNGHLGFNEPGSDFKSRTRVVELSEESIKSNSAYWGAESQVPRRAFTLGLGTLASSNHTLLLVSGAHKAGILHATLEGPQSPNVPATCLRSFRDVTVLADRSALPDAIR